MFARKTFDRRCIYLEGNYPQVLLAGGHLPEKNLTFARKNHFTEEIFLKDICPEEIFPKDICPENFTWRHSFGRCLPGKQLNAGVFIWGTFVRKYLSGDICTQVLLPRGHLPEDICSQWCLPGGL
jgi:hypothetical protein